MSHRLQSVLNVRRDEVRVAALLFAASFFLGAALIYTLTAANALFVSRIGAGALPLAYLGAAVALPVASAAHLALQRRMAFDRLIQASLLAVVLAYLVLRLALGLIDSRWTALAALVWYDVVLLVLNLEFWSVAGRLLDVRQAKRLYGLVGSGESVAGILGGLSVPLIVGYLGTANLLLLSAAAVVGMAAVVRMLPGTGGPPPEPRKRGGSGRLSLRRIATDRRLRFHRFILALVGASYFAYYVVDRLFYETLELRYPDPGQLAAFLGIVMGTADLTMLAVRLGLGSRFVRRFGLGAGLGLLPAVLSVGAAAVLLGAGLEMTGLVLWIAVTLKWSDRVVRHSLQRSSTLILYQPLPPGQRTGLQALAEGVVGPVAGGVAGFLLLLQGLWGGVGPVHFATVLLGIGVVWTMIAVAARNEYGPTVATPITRRERDVSPGGALDEAEVATVAAALDDGSPGRIRYALELLDRGVPEPLRPAVSALASHPSPEARLAVLERSACRRVVETSTLRRLVSADPSSDVRAAALRAVAAREGREGLDLVLAHLDDGDARVRTSAWSAALVLDPPASLVRLERTLAEGDVGARRVAAGAVGSAPRADAVRLLETLLEDPDAETRRRAVLAACAVDDERLWPRVLERVSDRPVRSAVVAGLRPGHSVKPALRAALAEPSRSPGERAHLLRLAGILGGLSAGELALPFIDAPDEAVRHAALEAIALGRYRASSVDRALLTRRLDREARQTAELLLLAERVRRVGLWTLSRFLDEEIARHRDRMLLLLAPLSTPEALTRARAVFVAGSRAHRTSALELTEHLLPTRLRRRVLPLLEGSGVPHDLRPTDRATADPLARILSGEMGELVGPLTVAVALIEAARRARIDLAADVEALTRSDHPVVRETAARVLRALERGAPPDDPDLQFIRPPSEARVLSTVEKVMVLRSVDVFSTTPAYLLTDIATQLELQELEEGETLFEKGSLGVTLYIVVAGRLRVHDGERTIAELGEHDVVGEMSALDPEPRSASVTAREDTRLLCLDQATLLEIISDRSEVARGIIQVLCRRLRATSR